MSEVKASTRLKTHPVCLSSGEGVTFEMEKYFTAAQPELGIAGLPIDDPTPYTDLLCSLWQ